MGRDIKEIRKEIDTIDSQMQDLFLKRLACSKEVAFYKNEHQLPIFDAKREKEVILKNVSKIEDEQIKYYYQQFLSDLMKVSKEFQGEILKNFKIGYCGTEGAFAHIAANKFFPYYEKNTYSTFEEVFTALKNKEIKKGVIPFENSYTGEVGEVLDLLFKYPFYIEEIQSIDIVQNLIGIKGSKIEDIKKIYTHPQAYQQSYQYLRDRNIEFIPFSNTALAAKHVKELNDKSVACIASLETAEIFDLEIIASNIQSAVKNQTKFIVISDQLRDDGNRFNVLFSVDTGSGKLAPIMDIIAKNGFDLESIRSRSLKDLPWQYYFYVEVVGSLKDDKTQRMIKELKENCNTFKIIGSYHI